MKNLDKVLAVIGQEKNGNVKFYIPERKSFLNIKVDELNLDTRSYNAIKRAKCNVVGDVVEKIGALSGIKGCGIKTINRILYQICARYYSELSERERETYLNKLILINLESTENGNE